MSSIKGRYARIEIPLNVAETEKELHIIGDYLGIIEITGEGTCEIKIDHRHSQAINLREISGITGSFERVYLTTDGEGGTCALYVGNEMAVHITADPAKQWNGGSAGTQITTTVDSVTGLANEPFKLRDVTILNSNGIYACYVGSYNPIVAVFKAYAYVLLPHKELKFGMIDMCSLGVISYDGVNNVIIDILGTYQ